MWYILYASIVLGHIVCLFAYGHTGSGKTYTIEGANADGIYNKVCHQLFKGISDRKKFITYDISVSVMEVYEDTIYDLASDQKKRYESWYWTKLTCVYYWIN